MRFSWLLLGLPCHWRFCASCANQMCLRLLGSADLSHVDRQSAVSFLTWLGIAALLFIARS